MSTDATLANKNFQNNLQWSLLLLRVGEHFYKISGFTDILAYGLGALQLILVMAFLFGIKKRLTYGLILLMHAGSTFSAYAQYYDAFNNLLFFAAWPMLAACAALYLLREADTKFTLGK